MPAFTELSIILRRKQKTGKQLMKRLKFLLLMLIFIGYAHADDVLPIGTEDGKENGGGTDPTSMNVKRPFFKSLHSSVIIYGNIVHFKLPSKNCTLYVYNEDDDLEYTAAIPDGTVTFTLPSQFTGKYKIVFTDGEFCYERNVVLF